MIKSDIFCLTNENGDLLPPAVQATILAKYSRSPLSAREIISQLSEEEADKFQEKWVGQYGHNSVAELANVPVCFENVSIIASKIIESWQRAGYSEKSTRYQEFSRDSFITPPGAPSSMKEFAANFYDAYEKLLPKMIKVCAEKMGEDPNAAEVKRTVKARAFDNVRYLLPAGTGTNLAAVLNMRDLRDMIVTLKSHENSEFNEIGAGLEEAGKSLCPALIRHTDPHKFNLKVKKAGLSLSEKLSGDSVELLEDFRTIRGNGIIEQETFEFQSRVKSMYGLSWEEFSNFMDTRPSYSEVPEIFKMIPITFNINMDYGAFRDLQRHRRCEQFVEPLTTSYGFSIPDDILGSQHEQEYVDAMLKISEYNDEKVVNDVDLFQYMIPLGYRHMSTFQMDLRELYYVVELRTKPQGHISYRRIAYQMYELAKERYPDLMKWCRAINPTEIGAHT